MSDLINALRSPRDMDEYLEARSAPELIAEIQKELRAVRVPAIATTWHAEDTEAITVLANACANVPYLATCIYETITRAGLKLVKT
jgi:hypothetical protein